MEEKMNNLKNAHISCISLNETGVPKENKPVPVLKEPFHLSYPFVFFNQGSYFMIPESAEAKKVTLYESMNFPYDWKPVRTLLEGQYYYDATLHYHTDGCWYLFCTQKSSSDLSSDAYLHIYFSSDFLNGKFEPHALNPIYSDVRYSRSAGALFYSEGKLIRPAQCGAPRYGYGINYFHIQELSRDNFKEAFMESQFPEKNSSILATHTINRSGSLQVMDQQVKRFKIFN
jgi:hypothetical protein